jgi:hypothetical protein
MTLEEGDGREPLDVFALTSIFKPEQTVGDTKKKRSERIEETMGGELP